MTEKETFDLVVRIGETMLQNGGEISRATETMNCAAGRFGIREFSAYAIANGIFASAAGGGLTVANGLAATGKDSLCPGADEGSGSYTCKVTVLTISPIHLARVEALNTLSRRIAAGKLTPEQAAAELERIRVLSPYGSRLQVLAAGVGSGSFCFLFGGGWIDCAAAFLAGGLAYAFLVYAAPRMSLSNIMKQIIGGLLAALFSFLLSFWYPGFNLDKIIIGAIFPMVPGVALTNAIRNFFENDYLTGIIRLVDALVSAACIACGVGLAMVLSGLLGGVL